VTIPCYVLNDGRRVLAQTAIKSALGMSRSGGKSRAHRVSEILDGFDQKGLKTSEISARTEQVVRFSNLGAPGMVHGIEAAVLVDLCKYAEDVNDLGVCTRRVQTLPVRRWRFHPRMQVSLQLPLPQFVRENTQRTGERCNPYRRPRAATTTTARRS
jgi:hypothetical protein